MGEDEFGEREGVGRWVDLNLVLWAGVELFLLVRGLMDAIIPFVWGGCRVVGWVDEWWKWVVEEGHHETNQAKILESIRPKYWSQGRGL